MERVLARFAEAVCRRPWFVLLGGLAAAALSVLAFASTKLDQDITALFPKGDRDIAALTALSRTLAGSDFALVVLTCPAGADSAALKKAADRLGGILQGDDAVARVRWKIPEEERRFYAESFLKQGLLFLPPEDLEKALAKFTPEGAEAAAAKNERLLGSPVPKIEEMIAQDPLGMLEEVFLPLMKRRSMGATLDFDSWHILSEDGRAALLQVWGKGSARDAACARTFMETVRCAIEKALADPEARVAGVSAAVTGGYAATLRNEDSVRRNMIVSFVGSFAGVLFLFMVAYRSVRVHLTAGLSLAVGVSLAFGAAAVALGFRMSALAAAFGAILAGLGIDYPIHLYHRFREEAAAGRPPREAVRETLPLAMLTVLPALLVLVEGRRASFRPPPRAAFGLGLLERAVGRAGLALAAPVVLFAAAAGADLALRGVPAFETDMRNLQPLDPEATRANDAIRDHFGISLNPVLAVVRAPTREAALEAAADVEARLEPLFRDGALAYAAGPGAFLPGPLRTARNRALAAGLDPDRSIRDVEAALERHGFDPEAFRPALDRMREALRALAGAAPPPSPAGPFASLLEPFSAEDGGGFLSVNALYLPL
ncbi:MAG: MMPL family transporter, partial [Planctomycetes bacterium]|nr:MMPL family transporter [Planctomycetota bacterium]